MIGMISRSYRKNKSVFWLPIAFVLVLSVVLYSGNVFSKDTIKRTVSFGQNEWDISEGDGPTWLTNQDSLRFTVNLEDDYVNYLRSIESSKEEPEPVDGEPGIPEVTENPNPENEEPVVPPTEGTEPAPEEPVVPPTEGTEPTPEEPPVVETPFKITVGEAQAAVEVIQSGNPFNGVYEVVVTLPTDLEDKIIPVTLDFAENDWDIPTEMKATFNFERDKTKPEITFDGVEDNELVEKADAHLKIEFSDKNFDPNEVVVDVKQDDNDIVVENEPDWTSGEGTIIFTQAGDYKVTVTTTDKAGNPSVSAIKEFSIYKRTAEFKVKNKREIPYYNHDVEIDVENDIRMQTFEVEINGEILPSDSPKFSKGWKKAHIKLEDPGYYEVKVRFTDRKQEDGPYEMGPYKFTIDKTKPVVKVSDEITAGTIYTEPKQFSINITDDDDNLDRAKTVLTLKHNGNVVREITGEDAFEVQKVNTDGVYEIDVTAVDLALNEDEFEPVTFTIDQTAPELSFNVSDKEYFNTQKEVVMTVFDELNLDLSQTMATVEKVGDTEFTADITFNSTSDTTAEAKHKFMDDGEYIITLTSKDKAGNPAVTKKVSFTIDKTPPKIIFTNIGEGGLYNEDRHVTITVSDVNMGESNVRVTQNDKSYDKIAPLSPDGNQLIIEHLFTEDGVYNLVVESTDKAGNQSSKTINFTVDQTGPEILFSIDEGSYFNNESVDLTVSVKDYTLEMPEIKVTRTFGGETEDIDTGGWLEEILWIINQRKTISLQEEGEYTVYVKAQDYFKTISENTLSFTIDHQEPVVEIGGIPHEGYVQGNNELIIDIKDLYVNPNKNEVLINNEPVKNAEWKKTDRGYQFKQSFPEDGVYEVIVHSEDFAGNKSVEKKHKFTVDNVKPVIDIEDVKDGSFYDKKQTATVQVNELNFANNEVNIEVTKNGGPYSIGKWNNQGVTSSLAIPFNEDGDYVIKVTSKDAAGNIAETKQVKFTVDETHPTVKISGVEHMTNYNVTKQVSFEVTDANIDQTSLRVTRNGQAYDVGAIQQSRTKASLTHNFAQEGSYVLYFNATDKSGNKTTHDEIAFIIDKTNPVVKIDGVDHQSFNPTGKRVTVSVDELNFGTNYVVLSVTKDGKVFNIGKWENNNKLSSLGYNFNDDGLYTVGISAEDKAGNGPITANKTFTIDTTKPAIEITGVENAQHYNVDKPVNIEIRDVNLDVNRVTVTRNGRGYNAGGFAVANQTARLSHNFSQEGDYSINVEAIDKAGNQFSRQIAFTIDKTAPVITPKFKGQSRVIKDGEFINEVFTPEFALDQAEDTIVSATMNGSNVTGRIPTASLEMKYEYSVLARDKAGNESTINISFTLDTTKPNLSITGVIDGFFNNNQAPTVTYSDRHLDSSRSSVTLNGRPFENGVQLADEGDYILKAEIYDLANNVSSRTIVFTIDKTAPVIRFKEAISDQYFNESLIPELLIEDLNNYDIISLTLNGQPYNLGDPIEDEGKHVLFFEVKDQAGNIQQLSVEFIIDKTPPNVIVDGVEKNETYRDPVTFSISLDNPSDTLKSVMINGELFDGDVKEVNGLKVVTVSLSDIDQYKVEVVAFDEAGNEINEVVEFEIVEKSVLVKFYENKPLFAGSMIGLVGVAAAGAVALRRSIIRRRDAKDM